MRIITLVVVVLLSLPSMAMAQGVSIFGAGGPTLTDSGYSLVGGIGLSPSPRFTLLFGAEQSHLRSRTETFPGGSSKFRGGTFTLGSAELRASIFRRARVSPYGLVGFAAGRSRLNVNESFPTPVTSTVRAPFAGGGVQVPLGEHAHVFADVRLSLIVGTDSDDLYALAPIRAGLSWRF